MAPKKQVGSAKKDVSLVFHLYWVLGLRLPLPGCKHPAGRGGGDARGIYFSLKINKNMNITHLRIKYK